MGVHMASSKPDRSLVDLPLSIGEIGEMARESGSVDLALGSPISDADSMWARAAVDAIKDGINEYSPPEGVAQLKDAILEYYRMADGGLSPSIDVCVTAGATEALVAALLSVESARGEVVIFEPCYEGYLRAILAVGAVPRIVQLRGDSWRFDEKDLRDVINRKTKAILLNSPHNPTGKVFDAEEYKVIADIVEGTDAVVISDEVYSDFYFSTVRPVSPASLKSLHQRTLRIGSASKVMGITGWRVGWLVGPATLARRVSRIHLALTACAPVPLQLGVAAALPTISDVTRKLRSEYQMKRDFTRNAFLEAGFSVPQVRAGFYLLVDLPEVADSKLLFDMLLGLAGIATVPLSMFYTDKNSSASAVRVAYCKKPHTLREAVSRLEAFNSFRTARDRGEEDRDGL
jgi:N-succinyldiaminopimelate aminotransferase